MAVLKTLSLSVCICIFVFLTQGCVVRSYEVERPRVDLEVSGNQGYIQGSSVSKDSPKKSNLSKKRKITVVEVEFAGAKEKEDVTEASASRGYLAGESDEEVVSEEVILQEPGDEAFVGDEDTVYEEEMEDDEGVQGREEYKLYTVQKSDTLQKISLKFYNTTRRWNGIYEANNDILKASDKIYPGQILKIPAD